MAVIMSPEDEEPRIRFTIYDLRLLTYGFFIRKESILMKMEDIIKKFVCKPSNIAIVGASTKPDRPVYGVMKYLGDEGFTLFPVNTTCAGEAVQGLVCAGSILDIREKFDILALFISPKRQQPILEEVLELGYRPIVWMQPGAENDEAESFLKTKGYEVVKGACLMMIHQVYCGD